MPIDPANLDGLRGARVLVTGAGISGRAVIAPLHDLGAHVTVTDTAADALARCAEAGASTVPVDDLAADPRRMAEFELVVTSPGFRPDAPVLAAAAAAGVPVWGDIEFTWHVDRSGMYGPPRQWLVVTGTNGKTTTTSMLHSILEAAGFVSAACGNIGLPVLDALRAQPRAEVLAVELSSFQLHWAPSVRPAAGVVLNIAEDHLDWHGGMPGYVDAKAQALTGAVAVVGLDDPVAASLADRSRDGRTIGFRLGEPDPNELGVVDGVLVDRAFADGAALVPADETSPPGRRECPTRWRPLRWPARSVSPPMRLPRDCVRIAWARTERRSSARSRRSRSSTTRRRPIRMRRARRSSRTIRSCGSPAACSRAPAWTTSSPRWASGSPGRS